MQSRFITKNPSNRRLILIFAGWSTTPSFYRHIHADNWDVAVVWDYTSLDLDTAFLKDYSTVFIVAWSMGVAAAAHAAATSIDPTRIAAAFAVNGTLYPSSDEYGIPEAVYEGTRATLSPQNLLKFTKRMGYIPPAELKNYPPLDDIYIPEFDSLALELDNMRSRALKGSLPWKRAYISLNDRIFPASSMQAAWEYNEAHPQIIQLDAQHYVDLQTIVKEITPNTDKIAKRFSHAVPTYDENAAAQRIIIDRLVNMLPEERKNGLHSLLEIGVGSGMLSRKLIPSLPLHSATFVDLFPVKPFGLVGEENYVAADAEEWLHTAPSSAYDIVASSNTIQWFADPASFFREVARTLRHGGIFLCSTFLPGNLKELDTRRPSPLLYRSATELLSLLPEDLKCVKTAAQSLTLTFPTSRALLRHLYLTGVATTHSHPHKDKYAANHNPKTYPHHNSADTSDTSGNMKDDGSFASGNTLTYRPFYILAIKD